MSEVEVLEPADIVPIGQVSIYASTDPKAQLDEARARAAVLLDVVREQGLARTFGGNPKPHVQVEGWQFLGSQFGLIADIEWTRELEDGWEARAAIVRLSDGIVISHAEAECRRSEGNWKNRDSYAIRSMAQTRATSKVFRNALSSVMVMAGFAATPAEEMDGIHRSESQPARSSAEPVSPGDPHCPACLTINGELVGVSRLAGGEKRPYWKCPKEADCAGAVTTSAGKTYGWSGWHESWQASAEEWLTKNGYEGVVQVEPPAVLGPSEWLKVRVAQFSQWDKKQKEQAYHAVVKELGLDGEDGRVDLTPDTAKQILAAMTANYYTEFPSDESRPF